MDDFETREEEIDEEFIVDGPMSKKKWIDKRDSLKKLFDVARFNEQKAKDNKEELTLMISTIEEKIKTFK